MGEPCTIELAELGWRCAWPCETVWFVTIRFHAARYPVLEGALAHALSEHGQTYPAVVPKEMPRARPAA